MACLTMKDYVEVLGSAATALAAIVAVVALVYARGQVKEARKQLDHSRRVATFDALLRLDEAFQRHWEVHTFLQPDFKWGRNKGGPHNPEEWFMVTSYMGLFERVNYLIDMGIEDIEMVDRFYGYRVYNLISNDVIRTAKLENKTVAPYWREFIHLWLKLKPLHDDWESYPEVIVV